jgi:hypothetical protein
MTVTKLHDTLAQTCDLRIDPNQCGPVSPGIEFAPWQRALHSTIALDPDTGAIADRR